MAYKIPRISPSALSATEHCPRFRPDGNDNAAAVDGTLMHEFAEQMVSVPKDQWAGWISTREASPDMKGMLEVIASRLSEIILEDLPVYPEFRLRMRGGKPRVRPLKPGLYPECELERGQGRHGYIDLMVVTSEGVVAIVDYKSNRVGKDFSLQLAAYASDVHRLAPAHTAFECHIVAPRLDDEEQLTMRLGPDELGEYERRIASIEELADRSCNDDLVPGSPCDYCQYCHWNGSCRYQARAAMQVVSETGVSDQVLVSAKTGKTSVVPGLGSLLSRGGPYAGEILSESTFTNPSTPAQRGLRRACLKFLETLTEAAKKDDASWAAQFTDDQLKNLVPGFSVSRRRGRGSVDTGRMPEIREAVMGQLGLSIEDVFDVSVIDKKQLAESLVNSGAAKSRKEADEKVEKIYAPFTSVGAPTLFWTQKAVTPALEA